MVSGGKCHLSQRANAHLVRACLCYFDIIKVDGIRLSEVIVPKIVQTIWKLVAGVASIVAWWAESEPRESEPRRVLCHGDSVN